MNYKPLFGTVSHNKGLFTIHYHKNGNCSAINKQGYDKSVFNDLQIPIIRFDKSKLENVLECIYGEFAEIEEYYNLNQWSKPVSLNQYLEHVKKSGVPVEIGFQEVR
jgi:hypothetical protein